MGVLKLIQLAQKFSLESYICTFMSIDIGTFVWLVGRKPSWLEPSRGSVHRNGARELRWQIVQW